MKLQHLILFVWVALASQAMADGLVWSPPMLVNRDAASDTSYLYDDYSPSILRGTEGRWTALWRRNPTPQDGSWATETALWVSESTDLENWTQPLPIPGVAMGYVTGITLREDSRGSWVLTWGGGYMSASTDRGASWSQGVPVGPGGPCEDFNGNGQGTWLAAWDGIRLCRSTNNGVSWSTPASPYSSTAASGPLQVNGPCAAAGECRPPGHPLCRREHLDRGCL